MPALSAEKAASLLIALPHWEIKAGELVRTYKFEDFVTALAFVNRIAGLAEKAGHHPDIDIRYNKVRLALVTHDAGAAYVVFAQGLLPFLLPLGVMLMEPTASARRRSAYARARGRSIQQNMCDPG